MLVDFLSDHSTGSANECVHFSTGSTSVVPDLRWYLRPLRLKTATDTHCDDVTERSAVSQKAAAATTTTTTTTTTTARLVTAIRTQVSLQLS